MSVSGRCCKWLRWTGLKGEDEFARPGLEAPTRTQAGAERELLELLEDLLTVEIKTLAARFKAHVLKHSVHFTGVLKRHLSGHRALQP